MEYNRIIQGHAIEVLRTFPDECVDCVVTSPPYWNMRNYATDPIVWGGREDCDHEWSEEIKTGQTTPQTKYKAAKEAFTQTSGCFCLKCGAFLGELGGEPTIKLFVAHLCDVFDEVKRVLTPAGACFVNMGDTYYSNHGGGNLGKVNKEVTEQLLSCKNRTLAKELQEGCLCLVPYRFAVEMTDRGWILKNNIVWEKDNAMPQSSPRKFSPNFEAIFFFVKNKDYYFKQQIEPYTEPINRWGGENLKADGESLWDEGTGQETYRDRSLRPNPEGRNMRCIWRINTEASRVKHWAAYPRRLVQIPVDATCPEDGVVLDPFVGSGTTCRVAYDMGRKYIGIDLNPEFVEISEKRLDQMNIFGEI